MKEDEEDAALASKKQPKKKKDLSKIKCFQCSEMGHFANHCPEKKRTRKHLLPKQRWQMMGQEMM